MGIVIMPLAPILRSFGIRTLISVTETTELIEDWASPEV